MALGYMQLVSACASDGATLTNSLVQTSLLPTGSRRIITGGDLDFVGKTLHLKASGRISTLAAAPGTFTFFFMLGATGATVVYQSQALALNVNAKANVTWRLELEMQLRSIGTGAALLTTGHFMSEAVIGSPAPGAGGSGVLLLPATAPAPGPGFDSSIDNKTDLQGQWSVANAANSITLHNYQLGILN